ncbi:hypothetical protein GGI05_000381 [Coemansia sp. RSA 2603]|nr:hypothetical protein GGI05_000381 [Coemansia sp. RSA 2603]
MTIQYGFLQGTFGLPYGGYCVRPRRLGDIVLSADSAYLGMFCVIGKYSEVIEWLVLNDRMVANQCTAQDTYTHDLIIEIYSRASLLTRIVRGRNNIDVQLVIRISRTWDRDFRHAASSQFKPILKVVVPSGVTLSEIREQLESAVPGKLVDATCNKELLDIVLTRVSSRSSTINGRTNSENPRVQPEQTRLPVYEYNNDLPPKYSS